MRFFCIFISATAFLAGAALAQDDVTSTTSALQSVLSNLKESAEELSSDNDQLAARDRNVQQQITQLQAQLGQLQAQGKVLNAAAVQLQRKNDRRSGQISRLEGKNSDLDDQTQKSETGIKMVQQALDTAYQQDQRLLLQLKGMSTALPRPPKTVGSPDPEVSLYRQKEKLKLMKMIYDSQASQEALHESILELQKNMPLQPAAAAMARQQLLKEQIRDLESQIASYPPEDFSASSGSANEWSTNQVLELQDELQALEKNYLQLKDLFGQMSKKAQSARMKADQHAEERKLQGNIEDLSRQGEGLRADMDDLRSQMVDLDKRKSYLDGMIKQLP